MDDLPEVEKTKVGDWMQVLNRRAGLINGFLMHLENMYTDDANGYPEIRAQYGRLFGLYQDLKQYIKDDIVKEQKLRLYMERMKRIEPNEHAADVCIREFDWLMSLSAKIGFGLKSLSKSE